METALYYKVLFYFIQSLFVNIPFLFLDAIVLISLFLFVISIFYIIPLTEDFCFLKIVRYVIS